MPTITVWEKQIIAASVPTTVKWELISHHEYPDAKTYVGEAEECTAEFQLWPEQIPGGEWFGKQLANAFVGEITKQGAKMLDLKVYEDTSPTLYTNYRIVAIATASPIAWPAVIAAVLAIIFIVAIIFLIKEIKTIDWGKAAAITTGMIFGIAALLGGGTMLVAAASKRR